MGCLMNKWLLDMTKLHILMNDLVKSKSPSSIKIYTFINAFHHYVNSVAQGAFIQHFSGARPTKHISIEFEIRWKFKTL